MCLKKYTEIKSLASMMETDVDDKYYYTDRLKIWDEISTNITNNISTGSIYQYRYDRAERFGCSNWVN